MFRIQENSADLSGKAAACGTGSGKHGEKPCETAQVIVGFIADHIKVISGFEQHIIQKFCG